MRRPFAIGCGVIVAAFAALVALIIGMFLIPPLLIGGVFGGIAGFFTGGSNSSNTCLPTNTAIEGIEVASSGQSHEIGTGPLFDAYLTSANDDRPQQVKHARMIVDIGLARNETTYDITLAVAIAIQESDLINILGGDRDSAGLYQQRPSQGWGTFAQVTDPTYAINRFYDELEKYPRTGNLIKDAIAVQRPSVWHYEQRWAWDDIAREIVAGVPSDGSTDPGNAAQLVSQTDVLCDYLPETDVAAVVQTAVDKVGTPYTWGGTDEVEGFDCSGLMQWAYAQHDIALPRTSREQYKQLDKVDKADLQPGDLVFWGSDSSNPESITHVAMWLGDDRIIEAPRPGKNVLITDMRWSDTYFGATRPVPTPTVIEAPIERAGTVTSGWQLPVNPGSYTVTSHWNPRRVHPVTGQVSMHNGIDLAAACGTPVYAMADGVVTIREYGYNQRATHYNSGNVVYLEHPDGSGTGYGHLQGFASGLEVGSRVAKGDQIGAVGTTGVSTGCHLHLVTETNHAELAHVNPVGFVEEFGLRF